MSSALSCPKAHLHPTSFFQCSSFPVLYLFIHFPNATSLLLHPNIQPLLLPFSVCETWDVCGDLQVLSPLEKQTQSISKQVSKLRGSFRNGPEGDLPLMTQSDSLGTCIHKIRAPKSTALNLTVASSLKVFTVGAGTLPGFLRDHQLCRNSKEWKQIGHKPPLGWNYYPALPHKSPWGLNTQNTGDTDLWDGPRSG